MVKKWSEYLKESIGVQLDGKNGFFMFLKLMDELKMDFIKTNHYLNIGKYSYFFTTEAFKSKTAIDLFDDAMSLRVTLKTLQENSDKRLSFYFGVKGYNLEYGICDDMSHEVYKTGTFEIDNKYLTRLKSYKCLVMIQGILQNSNIRNLTILHEIRTNFANWFPDSGQITILNDSIMRKSVPKKMVEDKKWDNILFKYEQWCEKFKWINKVDYYMDEEDEDTIFFYIKVKTKKREEL